MKRAQLNKHKFFNFFIKTVIKVCETKMLFLEDFFLTLAVINQ